MPRVNTQAIESKIKPHKTCLLETQRMKDRLGDLLKQSPCEAFEGEVRMTSALSSSFFVKSNMSN